MYKLDRMMTIAVSNLDKWSRVVFPLVFAGFQILYWTTYLNKSAEHVEDLVYLK